MCVHLSTSLHPVSPTNVFLLQGVYRRAPVHIPQNAKCLQEAKVCVMDNEQCAKKWAQRFRNIIQQYMICTKDVMKRLSEICDVSFGTVA